MKWKILAAGLVLVVAVEAGLFLARGVASAAYAANVPATVTATPPIVIAIQNAYRWFGNIDGLDPTAPAAAENAAVDAPIAGTQARLRMNIRSAGGAPLAAGSTLSLQYANATSGPWTDVGTSTAWAFFDNPSVRDGQIIANMLLASSTVGESYGESNPSAAMPTELMGGDIGEWDWSLINLDATTSQNWFFRMTYASGTPLDAYTQYPKLTASFLVPQTVATTTLSAAATTTYIFTSTDNVPVDFTAPPDFYSQDVRLQVLAYEGDTYASFYPPPTGADLISQVYNVTLSTIFSGASVATTSAPLTVVLHYAAAAIAGFDESTVAPYRRESSDSGWTAISAFSRDTAGKTVTFTTDSFSAFTLMASPLSPSGGGSTGPGSVIGVPSAGGGGTGYFRSSRYPGPPLITPLYQRADFNGDNRVDIVDLSILLYYYGRTDPLALRYDLSGDGIVDFRDVSILMYYWTGP